MNKRQQELLAEFLRLRSRYTDQDFGVVLGALREGRAPVEVAEMAQSLSRTLKVGAGGEGSKRPSDQERQILEALRSALDSRPVSDVRKIAGALGLGYEKGEKKPRLIRRLAGRLAELPGHEVAELLESFHAPNDESGYRKLAEAIMGGGESTRRQ